MTGYQRIRPGVQKAEELRSCIGTIDDTVSTMATGPARTHLLEMARSFSSPKQLSSSRRELVMHILDKYASTYEDTKKGYIEAFIQTDIFPGERCLPLDCAIEHFDLSLLSRRYSCFDGNVRILLKKYPGKGIIEAYSKRKMKDEIIRVFKTLGYSLKDLKELKVRITKDIKEIFD